MQITNDSGTNTFSYSDSHQILNSDGADLASCPGDVDEQTSFTTVQQGLQLPAGPVNDVAPDETGVPVVNRIMSGLAGGWNASPPPTLDFQWTRCDAQGSNCAAINGATNPTYSPTSSDVGSTLEYEVTASNPSGSLSVSSTPSDVVADGPTITQMGDTSTGFTSQFINSSSPPEIGWTVTAPTTGTSQDAEFFARRRQ